MAPKSIKLTYFNVKGRGEAIRWILKYSGVEFEDKRVEFSDWPSLKESTPTKTLPMLEVDGCRLGQSGAIALYLAGEFGLLGSNRLDEAVCHMVWDTVNDMMDAWATAVSCKDETRKAELTKDFNEKTMPKMVSIIKPLFTDGKDWLVGDKVSLADIIVAFALSDFAVYAGWMAVDSDLAALANRVRNLPAIKAWIETRPAANY